MSRTAIVPQTVTHTGTTFTTQAADTGNNNNIANSSGFPVMLYISNSTTVSATTTVLTNVTVDTNLAVPARTYTVAGGGVVIAGPFPSSVYNQSDNTVWVNAPSGQNLAAITHGN